MAQNKLQSKNWKRNNSTTVCVSCENAHVTNQNTFFSKTEYIFSNSTNFAASKYEPYIEAPFSEVTEI